jgi:cytochrome c oxidase cbb3-type subunit 4
MSLDLNDVRIFVTLTSLVLFIGLMVHTYSRARTRDHDAAALLPFEGEENERTETSATRRDS